MKLRFLSLSLLVVVVTTILFSLPVLAKIGVGVGAEEISLLDSIRAGDSYDLPAVRIFNTGDEITTYTMNVSYDQEYLQLRPKQDWFLFTPRTFTLQAGQSQKINIQMSVPANAASGDYFALIESGPVAKNEVGTSVGIAVGTKLFFTLQSVNFFQMLFTKFVNFSPWSWLISIVCFLILIILLIKKFLFFKFVLRKK